MGVALLALLIACSGAAVAAIPSSDGTISACRDNRTGVLRVIDAASAQTCRVSETQLAWKDGINGKVADSLHADQADSATNAANADTVDGKNASDFYAAGSKVADSELLEGQDSSAFLGANGKAADSDLLDGLDSTNYAAYKRTVVVSPTGTDIENGTALRNALAGITDASATKQYLIYIEPGTYELGTATLHMKSHVDIQGAGELQTVITSDGAGCGAAATVYGANDTEVRFLTVRSTSGTGPCSAAFFNDSVSSRLTHVTAESTGAGGNNHHGVFNESSSVKMTDVTAIASGAADRNIAVFNIRSSNTTITDVTAIASGADVSNHGMRLHNSDGTTVTQSKMSGSSSALNVGPGTAKVALSQIAGPILATDGIQCFNNYDENLAAVTCPQ
jgi:hypothetical protein